MSAIDVTIYGTSGKLKRDICLHCQEAEPITN